MTGRPFTKRPFENPVKGPLTVLGNDSKYSHITYILRFESYSALLSDLIQRFQRASKYLI